MFHFIISFLISFIYGVIKYDTSHIEITNYQLKTNKIKKNIKICLLSDLHGGEFEKNGLLKAVRKTKPDIVIMAGDMANAKFKFSDGNAIKLIRELSKDFPIYYGIGNHEARLLWSPERFNASYEQLLATIRESGAVVLDNNTTYIDEYGINITGLSLNEDYYRKIIMKHTDENSLKEFINDIEDNNIYEILIAHNPEYFRDYENRKSDLVVSGHLHGGIMRLPFKFGAISPRFMIFPRYAGGMYKSGNTSMIVSRGLGQHTIPIRIFNTAELVVINIKNS